MDINTRPKIIGARVQRREDPRLLTGNGAFVDDRQVPGMLHLAFRRSDFGHAKILKIDTEEAASMPGIIGIYTAETLNEITKPVIAFSNMKDYQATPIRALAQDVVRYVGEPVVVVVAENRYLAEDALNEIFIDYEPLENVVDPEYAASGDAVLVHEDLKSNILVAREFERGEVDEAMSSAAIRVKGRFRSRRKTAVAMETRSYLAEFEKSSQSLTLHSSTQIPGIIRDALVDILDIPGHRLRVVAPDVGGGFGGKASLYPEEIVVTALSKLLKRSVKWTSDRMEDLMSTSQAFDEIIDAELGLDSEGNLLALSADVLGDVGAYSIYPWTAALEPIQVVSFMPGPYRLANYRGKVRGVATNKPPTGPYRGVGRPASTFVMERLMDMAAGKLGMDPAELRLKNFVVGDEFPYRIGSGIVWDKSEFSECLNKATEKLDYETLREKQRIARSQGRLMGIGIASYAELTGIGSRISAAPGMPINTGTETARIRVDSSGSVIAYFGVASHGQSLETTLAQVVAEEMGVKVEDVEVVLGDSAVMAHSTGTYASRSAVLAGGAGTLAARAVREKIVEAASLLFEVPAEEIDVYDGLIHVSGTNRKMDLRELARAVYSEMGRFTKEVRENLDLEATKLYDPYFGTTTSASHIAVVDIDPETFKVKIEQYVVSEDCGRMINPLVVDGQVHGGVAQGIGAALYEEVIHDENGQVVTASLVDYLVPSSCEVPTIDVLHADTRSPSTIGGFRGMGEGGTIGAPAAIANAVADALAPFGIEINEIPISPERLYRLIEKARNSEKD